MSNADKSDLQENENKQSNDLSQYRDQLSSDRLDAQRQFDKVLLSLSGGAWGISFAFLEKFVKPENVQWKSILIFSWSSWAASILIALIAFYLAPIAFNIAIKQVDDGTIYSQHPGRCADKAVSKLNFFSMLLFISGIILIIIFIALNYGS